MSEWPDERQATDWNEHNAATDSETIYDELSRQETQEANEMATSAAPALTVIGNLPDGNKLVQAEWTGEKHTLSPRTLKALQTLGMTVNDNPDNYVF